MDTQSITLILALAGLLLFSAYFSATETAFSSMSRTRLKTLAQNGSKRAARALAMSENYDNLISAILIGNNVVNILSASLATVLFVKYYGNSGVTISTVVMTVLVLIFGEITPKSLAKEKPESFAMFSAPLMRVFLTLLFPLTFLFGLWKKLLSKVFRFKNDSAVTEEELLVIVDEAQQDGGIDEEESELIRSAIEFNDMDAIDIYTPRVDVEAVEECDETDEIADLFHKSGYSRLPVYHEDIDNIIGIIHEKDFHNFVLTGKKSLSDIVNPAVYIPPTMKISKLLKLLQQKKSHMAIVTDEFGGTQGIVTLEDILETLVGEIWDEHDEIVEDFTRLAEDEYLVAGDTNLEKMFDYFDLSGETDTIFSTVSGWVMDQLGRIPREGDTFAYENLAVTVGKVDARRVLEVAIKILPKQYDEED